MYSTAGCDQVSSRSITVHRGALESGQDEGGACNLSIFLIIISISSLTGGGRATPRAGGRASLTGGGRVTPRAGG